jgi:hypothetical protein
MGDSAGFSMTMRAAARAPAYRFAMDLSRRSLHMTQFLALTIATAHLWGTPLRAAEIYKTVDAEGHVVYTDHADPDAPKTAVQVDTQSAKQAAKAAKLQAAHKAADPQRRKQQAIEAAKIAQLDRDARVQCDVAQKNFYAMKAAGATDAAAAMKREQARQNMVLACTD